MICAGDHVMPIGDLFLQSSLFGAIGREGVVSQRQVHGRFWRGGELDDCFGKLHRVSESSLAALRALTEPVDTSTGGYFFRNQLR